MVEDFKEIYKVKAELKVFGKPMFHDGKETGTKDHFINLKITTEEKISLNVNVIAEPFIRSQSFFKIEDLISFLMKSEYTKGNFELPKSLFKENT